MEDHNRITLDEVRASYLTASISIRNGCLSVNIAMIVST